jgi:hypothetical protein
MDFQWNPNGLVGSGCSLSRVEARLRSATACFAMAVLDFA